MLQCQPIKEEDPDSSFEIIIPTTAQYLNTLRESITKNLIERDCRENKCKVNLDYMNGYKKIVEMVEKRKNSENFSFDVYMNRYLRKADFIFNTCYYKEYIENHKEIKEEKSLRRVDTFLNPEGIHYGYFVEDTPQKRKIVATIDLTEEKETEINSSIVTISSSQSHHMDVSDLTKPNGTDTNSDIITIPSSQSQVVVSTILSSKAGTIDLTKQNKTETNIITIQSTQSQEVIDARDKIIISSQEEDRLFKKPEINEIITIPSTQPSPQSQENDETHATFITIREEAISSIIPTQDLLKTVDSEQPNEINTEEVLNQTYDNFDNLVFGLVQSTQNSDPYGQLFLLSPNQEKANDINWDDC